MRKMLEMGACVAMCAVFCTGCMTTVMTDKRVFDDNGKMVSQTIVTEKASPLKDKSMTVDASGYGLKLTTAVDPSSGTALPSLDVLVGRTHLGSSPMPQDEKNFSYEYLSMDRSMWNNNMTGLVFERKASGKGAEAKGSITISIEADTKKNDNPTPLPLPMSKQESDKNVK